MKQIKSHLPYCLTTLLLFLTFSLLAQDSSSVVVIKDPRIDLLVKKQAQINKVSGYKNSRGEYKGYRVMVLNTNDRDLAYKTRAEILRSFPDQNVYMAYQSPYYKLKVGDFLKRSDADKIKKDLSVAFNQTTYVIEDIIKLTPEQEAKLLQEEEKK